MNRPVAMVIFGLIATAIVSLIHYYLWARLVRDAHLPSPYRQIATAVIILLAVSLPVIMIVGRGLPFHVSRYMVWVPYVWMGMMMMLAFFFGATDLLKGIAFLWSKISPSETTALDPSRREMLGRVVSGGVLFTVFGLSGFGIGNVAKRLAVLPVPVKLRRFPRALNGFKIAQISDLHVGLIKGYSWLEEVVRRVNDLNPDLIAITGDLVDGSVDKLNAEIGPLAKLKARHGVFFVTGNHEYYSGAIEWVDKIESLGIRVLRNERVQIGEGEDSFDLAGVDDFSASPAMAPNHGPDLPKALSGRDTEREVVLLAHQPRAIDEAAQMDVGLVLSGHTHGGQIWPFTYLVGLQQPYNRGLYRHTENTQIYVNQGTGVWGPPMRVGTQSEITEIELSRG